MPSITFEIIYLAPEGLFRKQLHTKQGTSVADAVARARTECAEFPREAWQYERFAIYGTLIEDTSRPLAEGDRIEILRPLEVDPVEARRLRAQGRA